MSGLCTEESKRNWSCSDKPTSDDLKLGCLQRIATATEVMAQSHQTLIEERDRYKRWYEKSREKNAHMERRINSLRGVITKLKGAK